MAVNPVLRAATEADVPTLLEVERAAFTTPHWSAETFLSYDCTVAEVGGLIAGFLVSRQIFIGDETAPPEREILNLGVAPQYRRNGIATMLLRNELLIDTVYLLEVRESNQAARILYGGFGFVEIYRRRDYYDNPAETAIVMRLK